MFVGVKELQYQAGGLLAILSRVPHLVRRHPPSPLLTHALSVSTSDWTSVSVKSRKVLPNVAMRSSNLSNWSRASPSRSKRVTRSTAITRNSAWLTSPWIRCGPLSDVRRRLARCLGSCLLLDLLCRAGSLVRVGRIC